MQLATSLPAFTLVELMLSLAMVLILIVGINFVFRSATDAVGAGNALNSINSDTQATQPTIFDDLRNVAKNPPCFIISSQFVTQFLNADDAKSSSDPTVIVTDNAGTTVNIGNFTVSPATSHLSAAILNNRNHRADMLKFLAHGLYHRRSGPDGTYYASDSSNDAFIEYGHAALPSNDLSTFYGPSGMPNTISGVYYGATVSGVPRIGAYASDWVLTRRVTLLKDPKSITNWPPTLNDYYYPVAVAGTVPYGIANWNAQSGITAISQFGVGVYATPLSYGTPDNNVADNPPTPGIVVPINQFQSSRYDLAGVTPEQLDRLIANGILTWQAAGYVSPVGTPQPPASLWWNPLVYALPVTQNTATAPQYLTLSTLPYVVPCYFSPPTNSAANAFLNSATPPVPNLAYAPLSQPYAPLGIDPGLHLARPQCNPTIQSPVTAASLAEMAPYFLQHCSQFIVEYAGDYMQQDVNGNMTGLGPDGQIDFYLDANGNKHIRWYGMPRSATGVPHLDGPPGGSVAPSNVLIRGFDPTQNGGKGEYEQMNPYATTPTSAMLNYFTDVIPLRDYYSLFYSSVSQQAATPPSPQPTPYYACPPWEVDLNFDCARDYGSYLNINTPINTAGPNKIAFNDPNNPPRYVAAWHDDMPAMIRILIKVDDPNNKVKDGPWYEYVFRLK
ncbi:MAG: hypothetical protein ABSD28_09290 [Tepidisphaeraceae bacterium]